VPFHREAFHRDAIKLPSHEDVTAMRAFLVDTLAAQGHDAEVDDAGNVLATRGIEESGATHIVLNTHLDTVPPHRPYERDGDIVRGRGACDAKGPLTAMVDAFCAVNVSGGRVTLAVTPNEETSQRGGAQLADRLTADGYIVGEPTGLDVCPAARGNFGGHVTLYGESAHASDPTAGTNPLSAVGDLISALERYDERAGPGAHELLGRPTLAPTRIEGGGPLNQTPASVTVSFDRRTVPPETIDGFVASLEPYLLDRLPTGCEFTVEPAYPDSPAPEAFATPPESELVQLLAEASGGTIRPFGAATEASYFAPDGPTVVFGPGELADSDGPVAHADREYIHLSAIADASEIIQATVERLLH
jgi:acetylornithine deacetylase